MRRIMMMLVALLLAAGCIWEAGAVKKGSGDGGVGDVLTSDGETVETGQLDARNMEMNDGGLPGSSDMGTLTNLDAETNDRGPNDVGFPPENCRQLRNERGEVLVEIRSDGTCIRVVPRPTWAKRALLAAAFTRPSGKQYDLLVYSRPQGELIEEWMSGSEVGDAYLSYRVLRTQNNVQGYVYETHDYGGVAAVHITVASVAYVYYLSSSESQARVPEDFTHLIGQIEVR